MAPRADVNAATQIVATIRKTKNSPHPLLAVLATKDRSHAFGALGSRLARRARRRRSLAWAGSATGESAVLVVHARDHNLRLSEVVRRFVKTDLAADVLAARSTGKPAPGQR